MEAENQFTKEYEEFITKKFHEHCERTDHLIKILRTIDEKLKFLNNKEKKNLKSHIYKQMLDDKIKQYQNIEALLKKLP